MLRLVFRPTLLLFLLLAVFVVGMRAGYGLAVPVPTTFAHSGCSIPCAEGIEPGKSTRADIDALLQTGLYGHEHGTDVVSLWGEDDSDEVVEFFTGGETVRHVTVVYSRRCTEDAVLSLGLPDDLYVIDGGDTVLLNYNDYQLTVIYIATPSGMNVSLAYEVSVIYDRISQYNKGWRVSDHHAVNLFNNCRG